MTGKIIEKNTKLAFEQPLHVGQSNLPSKEKLKEQFRGIFERRFFTNHGPIVRELDERLSDYFGVKHAVSVTNGTVALMCAIVILGLKGEVVVPSFTFPATVHALTWAGVTPVFCDVDMETHTITPENVEQKITQNTSAILGVHLWGRACNTHGLKLLAERYNLKIIFDAAHAIGSTFKGEKVGCFGDIECFSFHATTILNAAEGGCITTNDDSVGNLFRTARNFHTTETFGRVFPRINGKMTEAQAAMALLSLDDLPKNIAMNKKRYEAYANRLKGLPGVKFVDYAHGEKSSYQYIVVKIDEEKLKISRNSLVAELMANNVLARTYFSPGVHKARPYCELYPEYNGTLPVTEHLSKTLMQLPNGQSITLNDIETVCDLICEIVEQNLHCEKK